MKLLLAILLIFSTQACSSSAKLKTDDIEKAPAEKDESKIKVYSEKDIGAPYKVVGTVVNARDGSAEGAVDAIKSQAAELGADAIVDLRIEVEYGYWDVGVKATGVAVVLK